MVLQGTQSEIGHGALGLRAPLRPRVELIETSAYEKHTFMEGRPVRAVSGWTLESGTTWRAPTGFTFLSVVVDIVWVRTSLGRLNRKETLAKCQATTNSYFYDPDASAASFTWDDGVSVWDGTPVWDADPVLYVNMPGGVDPTPYNVVALCGIFIGNFGVPQPTLHREDALVDGSFEDEGTRGDPFLNWVESFSGTNTDAQPNTVDFKEGTRSAELLMSGSAAGSTVELRQVANPDQVVPGKVYWLGGWYKTDAENHPALDLEMAVGDETQDRWLSSDGRSYDTLSYFRIAPTAGEWRRALFAFVMPPGDGELSVRFRFINNSGALAIGSALLDGWKCRRVLRMNDYHPWLPSGGLPALQVARPDGYFGEWNIGLGAVRFLNHNRALDPLFTRFNWIGQELVIRGGGRFPGQGGDEVLFDDLALQYVALPKRIDLSDREAQIPVRDQRELLKLQVPPDTYGTQAYAGVEQRFNGRPIPILYGICNNLTPTQYDIDATSGLPVYDVASNARLDEGSPSVRVFVDEEAASKQQLVRSVLLSGSEWVTIFPHRAFKLLEHPGPIEIEAGVNDMLDVTVDGNVREVLLTPGLYRLEANGSVSGGLLPQVESKLDALPDSDFTVDLLANQYKPRIGYSGATLNLLIDSGVNKHRSAWKTLGFTGKDDLTGLLTYEADTALYDSTKAADFVVRMYGVHGQHDDSDGTYTGTPDAIIERQCDVAYHLIRGVIGFDVSQIDLAALESCRLAVDPSAPCDVVIAPLVNGRPTAREYVSKVMSRLETGGKMDVLLKGTIWTITPRDSSTPADIVTLEDRDYLLNTWKTWLEDQDVYYVVRVLYGRDASTGDWRKVEANPGGTDWVPQNHGRFEDADFETYLRNYSDVLNRLASLAAIAVGPIRHYTFTSRGRVFEIPPGGKLISNRTHGMTDPLGVIGPIQMRVLSKVDNAESHESQIIAMTDIG